MIRVTCFGRIEADAAFWALPASGRIAALAHEVGHKYHGHHWRRFVVYWLRWLIDAGTRRRLYHAWEFEADAFARQLGFGSQLAAILATQPHEACITHPSTRERVARLVFPC